VRSAVEVRPVAPGDCEVLAANLRQQDQNELDAAGHTNHLRAIRDGVARSDWAHTATVDGQVACIFGVAPLGGLLDPRGVPWMLGTDLVPQNRRALARLAPRYIREMLQAYPHLLNTVHARNTLAVRWLARAGFTLHAPHDHNGEPFQLFEMRQGGTQNL
jgi:hypothetical protein